MIRDNNTNIRYRIFLFMAAPAHMWTKLWASLLGCEYFCKETPPEIGRFESLDPALNMFKDGQISAGKMRECALAWKNSRAYSLPEYEHD